MTLIHKAAASAVGPDLEFVLSDETVDRFGDVIVAKGWLLANFKRNPIALFGHSRGFPIGKWANVRVEGDRLVGRLDFASEGTSQRIDELRRLVEQGVLRAVSVGFRPIEDEAIDEKNPWAGRRYLKQELLECSLVSVPANPAALAVAKGLRISDDVMTLAFGEHADGGGVVRRDHPGKHAASRPAPKRGNTTMKTISQRVEDAQARFNEARDAYNEHVSQDDFDIEAAGGLDATMKEAEARFNALKAAETALGQRTAPNPSAPAVNRRPLGFPQSEVKGVDLIVRATLVRADAMFSGKSIDAVLDARYPGHEATSVVAKADATIGTTGVSGWAAELVQTSYAEFVDALRGKSIYPELRDRGFGVSFDQSGTAYIPSLTAGGANGSFFGEGQPIRVGRITTASTTMTPRKLGVIVPFSREAAKRSTPSLEALVRKAILDDTAAILDSNLLDATASDSIRPAGLLNGVSAVASGYGGGDYQAVIEDINNLMDPFDTANASGGIALIMHPKQARKLAMMPGPDGTFGWADRFMSEFTVLKSTHATAGRLIAVRVEDFATATGDAPDFEMSNTATIHMEDTTPLEIVSGTGPTAADPVRSFFQTDVMGIRMVQDVSWKMRRSGMVQWINGTSW